MMMQAPRRRGVSTFGDTLGLPAVVVLLGIATIGSVTYSTLGTAGLMAPLTVCTWNVAAINNNPFEYWITYDENPLYQKLMVCLTLNSDSHSHCGQVDLQRVMQSPARMDVPVATPHHWRVSGVVGEGGVHPGHVRWLH